MARAVYRWFFSKAYNHCQLGLQFPCTNQCNRCNHFEYRDWEIIGTIKRNAANVTSIVGTPTVTVIAADTAAANWDARITADDTNESLKVEVKHDSANNVRFSLNIIATETRV